MKNRLGLLFAIVLLIAVAVTVSACEKERPVPTPTRSTTPAAVSTGGARSPQGSQTGVAQGAATSVATKAGSTGAAATSVPAVTVAPPASTSAAPAGSGSEEYFTYKVVPGDTLASVARKFNVTAESIVTLNYLPNPNVLISGTDLKIPGIDPGEQAPGTSTYVVRSGDTLYTIAKRFGVTLKDLQTLNKITDPSAIYAGQVLRISSGTPAPAATGAAPKKTYVVQAGDTLNSIAVRHGLTTEQLRAANNISNANAIYVGQVLTIP